MVAPMTSTLECFSPMCPFAWYCKIIVIKKVLFFSPPGLCYGFWLIWAEVFTLFLLVSWLFGWLVRKTCHEYVQWYPKSWNISNIQNISSSRSFIQQRELIWCVCWQDKVTFGLVLLLVPRWNMVSQWSLLMMNCFRSGANNSPEEFWCFMSTIQSHIHLSAYPKFSFS